MAQQSKPRIATGLMTGVSTSITLQHNLNTKKVMVFWIAEPGAVLNVYTQVVGAFVFPESYEQNGYKGGANLSGMDITFSGKDSNDMIGWVGYVFNSANVSIGNMNNCQFYYGKYNDGGFVNDGNTVTINCRNRTLSSNATYRWFVIALD